MSELEVTAYKKLVAALDGADVGKRAKIYEYLITLFCSHVGKNGYVQGTPEWVAIKKSKFYFGGTAMGYFTGAPFKNLFDLVAEKSEASTNTSDLHIMAFGSLFEELIKRVSEHDCGIKVHGENIYIMATSLNKVKPPGLVEQPIAYSPDGIALIDTAVQGGPNVGIIPCLLEYKCPWSRYINGKVPEEYVAQQQMGMDVISRFSEINLDLTWSLYLEAAFRVCRLSELAFNAQYDPTFNVFKNKPPIPFTNIPVAIGIIGFVTTNSDFELRGDFGKLSHDDLKRVICSYSKGEIQPIYSDPIWHGETEGYKNVLQSQLSSILANCVGFLPYKLFRRDYHWFQRKDNFLDFYLPRMMEVAEIIQEVRKEPQDSRMNALIQLMR